MVQGLPPNASLIGSFHFAGAHGTEICLLLKVKDQSFVFSSIARVSCALALRDSQLELGRRKEAGWPLESLELLLLKLRKLKTFSAFVTRGSYDNDLQDLTSPYLFYPYDLNRKYRDKPRLTQTDLINKSLQLLRNITTYPRLSVSKQESVFCL